MLTRSGCALSALRANILPATLKTDTCSPNGNSSVEPGRARRSIAAAAELARLPAELAGREHALAACRRAEAALLCVPDAEIAHACATIAAAVPSLRFVGHVSGATTLDVLAPARERGAGA